VARQGHNYVLTTGTGSGKSLAYIVPIVDYVLRHGTGGGIKAIVVYPMNALANSQYGELAKFLCYGYADGKGPVRFERYTGQEDAAIATRLFGAIVLTDHVIGETLRRATPAPDRTDPLFRRELAGRVSDPTREPPGDFAGFMADPLSSWIESVFGVVPERDGG